MKMDYEDRYEAIESALTAISGALDDLKGSGEDDAIAALSDVEWDLKHKLNEIGKILDEREDAELAYLNREYERST